MPVDMHGSSNLSY